MSIPRIVPADEWLAQRKELLAAEEQADAALASIGERRRAMPAVKIEKEYLFEGLAGKVTLLDMFEGRRQLIVQHFMFDPTWDEGCPVCSYQADSVGNLAHLNARNTTFAAVSRAPIGKIEPFRQRMGWPFPYYSSLGSDFNYDFHVTHDEDVAPIEWNFRTKKELIDMGQPYFARPGEQGGVSVFYRAGDAVLHTYTGYSSVAGLLCTTDQYLDLTPLGRQDEDVELLHHDKYAASRDGRQLDAVAAAPGTAGGNRPAARGARS
jgi:predicted dithiol-disulfide oxidoreductase (DUF899 family)